MCIIRSLGGGPDDNWLCHAIELGLDCLERAGEELICLGAVGAGRHGVGHVRVEGVDVESHDTRGVVLADVVAQVVGDDIVSLDDLDVDVTRALDGEDVDARGLLGIRLVDIVLVVVIDARDPGRAFG